MIKKIIFFIFVTTTLSTSTYGADEALSYSELKAIIKSEAKRKTILIFSKYQNRGKAYDYLVQKVFIPGAESHNRILIPKESEEVGHLVMVNDVCFTSTVKGDPWNTYCVVK